MKECNLEFSEMKLLAEKILHRNFIKPVASSNKSRCDMCGQNALALYDYVDGYSHTRWVCSACALINTPFVDGNFRVNSLTKGILIINPETLSLTIITSGVNISKINQDEIHGIELIDSNDDIYATLVKVINNSKSLSEKRYIIELGKRMHQYIHLTKASFDGHLYIATENTGLHLNISLVKHIVGLQKTVTIEDVTTELKRQIGYLDKPTLRAYSSVIKEVLEE